LHRSLFRAAAEAGVRVFLDGTDGDTTVNHGLGRLDDLALSGRWVAFAEEVHALSRRFDRTPRFYLTRCAYPHLSRLARRGHWVRWLRAARTLRDRLGVSAAWLLYRHGIGGLVPSGAVEAWRGLRGRSQANRRWIDPAFARSVRLGQHRRILETTKNDNGPHSSRESHRRALENPLFQYVFEVNDRAASHVSLEPRYPFCDRRLIEFCLAVPTDQQLRDGWSRFVLRRGMEGIVPEQVRWRVHKQNLSPGAIRSLREKNRDMVRDALFREPRPLAGYADMATLQRVFDRFVNDPDWRGRNTDHAMILYQATTLSRWLRGRPFAVGPLSIAESFVDRADRDHAAAVAAAG
jgi:asparagine synthase (glutamine-hydrolysing)